MPWRIIPIQLPSPSLFILSYLSNYVLTNWWRHVLFWIASCQYCLYTNDVIILQSYCPCWISIHKLQISSTLIFRFLETSCVDVQSGESYMSFSFSYFLVTCFANNYFVFYDDQFPYVLTQLTKYIDPPF